MKWAVCWATAKWVLSFSHPVRGLQVQSKCMRVCPALWMAVNEQMLGWTMCESARLLLIALLQISNWPKHDSICSQFTTQHFSAQLTDGQWHNYNNLLHLSVKPVPEDNFITQGFIFFSSGELCFNHKVQLQSFRCSS